MRMLRLIKRYPKQTDAALLVLGFVIGMNLLAYIKLAGMQTEYFYEINPSFHLLIPTLGGLLIGTTLAITEFTLFEKLYARLAHRQALLFRLIITALIIVSGMVFIDTINRILYIHQPLPVALEASLAYLKTDIAASLLAYMFALSVLLNFFRQLGNHFGHGLIVNFVTGRYARLQEEHRTFMFLDLNQSTTIAERIGHVKYSRLLNQCFNDLSGFLARYEADVYQYVGDEVVLTWLTPATQQRIDVPGLYFAFYDKLQHEAPTYQAKFGAVPQFKASVHSGLVSITQVGQARKELAYHGDVLNTAARILNIGSKLKKDLLVTAPLASVIRREDRYAVRFVDTLLLRGKHETTEVFEVRREEKAARPVKNARSSSTRVIS